MPLEPGESLDLDTRVDGGPVATRDESADDVLVLDRPYESLDEGEIRRLAEAVGLEVSG
jgi:hypothetical protein